MGADAFISFYGIEEMISADADISELEERTDVRMVNAKKFKLDSWWGRVTDGSNYHLLIGKKIAEIGIEGNKSVSISDQEFATLKEDVKKKLKDAGFLKEPKLILKLEAQY